MCGLDEKKLQRGRSQLKNIDLRKKNKIQNADVACWAWKKTIFKTKNIHFETSNNSKTLKRDPVRFFNIHSVAKYQKMKGGPFGDFKKIFDEENKKCELC